MWMTAIRMMIGVLLCLLPACASEPAFIPLRPDVSQQLTSSNGVIVMSQKDLVADIERSKVSTYTGGGLIPALIDVAVESSRASAAEDNLKPIRKALMDYEVGTELHNALKTRLNEIQWLHIKKTELSQDDNPKPVQNLLADSSEDALLLLRPTYALTWDFQILRVETEVRVVPRAPHLILPEAAKDEDKRMRPLYKTTVSHSVVLAGVGTQEDVAKAVSSNGGEKIKDAMQQSVSAIADSIIEALNHPEKKTY